MRFLVVSQYFDPEPFRIGDVCKRLAAMGHEVIAITGLPNYPAGSIFDGYTWPELQSSYDAALNACVQDMEGVTVLRCNLRPRLTGKKNLALNYMSFWKEGSKVAMKLAGRSESDSFDQILVFQYSPVTMAIPALRFRKHFRQKTGHTLPLCLYCFDLWPESIVSAGLPSNGPIYACIKALSKKIYKAVDQIFASSQNFESYFKQKLGLNKPIKYLPIYAEDLFLESSSLIGDPSNISTTSDMCNFLFAGNMGEMQSLDTILTAASHLQKTNTPVHFHLVGDGSAYEKSMALSEELHLSNVTFYGRRPLEDMPVFYQMADAFLVTLKDDTFISYTLPGKVQSYMAAGKPILGAINGETASVISKSQCGLCCPAEDDRAFANILSKFAEEKEKHRKYGANAKAYYDANFSVQAFFDRLFSYIS